MSLSTEANLLFGLIALQNSFITRDELILATGIWLNEKSRPFSEVLKEHSKATDADFLLVELLLKRHCERNSSASASLAVLAQSDCQVAKELSRLDDGRLAVHFDEVVTDADPFATLPEPVAPTVRFKKLRSHAKGGLGHVFVAVDSELDREVALKEIQARIDDESSRKRFLTEAMITGQLEHPGICPIYGLGLYPDGRPYYAMKFIRGKSLNDAITEYHDVSTTERKERSYTLRRLLARLVSVCNTIHFAHSRRIIHRDIKPDNIMLGNYGETLVVDWGMAKLLDQRESESVEVDDFLVYVRKDYRPRATQTGSVMGTLAFASPEQILGRNDLVGPLSDIYSLGATLYILLTGEAPFFGRNVAGLKQNLSELRRRVQTGDFPRPRQVKAEVSESLEEICLKAMALVPEQRYSTAKALGEALEKWLADEPIAQFLARVKYFEEEYLRTRSVAASERYGRELANYCLILASLERNDESVWFARQAIETFNAIVSTDPVHRIRIQQEIIFIRQQEIRSLIALNRLDESRAAQLTSDRQIDELLSKSIDRPDLREELLNMTLHLGLDRKEIEKRMGEVNTEDTFHGTANPPINLGNESREDRNEIAEPLPSLHETEEVRNEVIDTTPFGTFHSSFEFVAPSRNIGSIVGIELFAQVDLRVTQHLGLGGSSVVYEAMELDTYRRVAIKVAREAQFNQYLEKEVRIISQLQHPAILPLYYRGVTLDKCVFFAMPLIKSFKSLRDLCRKEPSETSIKSNVLILARVCDAVNFAHSSGVIHRDIKPFNIFLDLESVYLTDWSLALVQNELASPGMGLEGIADTEASLGGTPVYMAPEQADSSLLHLQDRTTDVYLLGATLYEILCGKPPQRELGTGIDVASMLKDILDRKPIEPVDKINPKAPRLLVDACNRAMKFDQCERYPTAADFRQALDQWLFQ